VPVLPPSGWALCEHLVAADDDDIGLSVSPVRGAAPPTLAPEPGGVRWSDDQLREVFGDLHRVLDAYGGDLSADPNEVGLVHGILELIGAPVLRVRWRNDRPMAAVAGSDWYSPCPRLVREQAREALGRMAQGFELLAARGA
jgi:hypothetical protein